MSDSFAEIERVTGRKARGPQVAGRNKLQVTDFFPFSTQKKVKDKVSQLCQTL